jgi:hypothetical protein
LNAIAPLFAVASLIASPALAGGGSVPARPAPQPIAAGELALLRGLERPALGELRAGSPAPVGALAGAERQELRRAQAAAPELAAQRAGELSNSDLTVVLLAAAVILLIIIVA